ncbi:hypothetical protein GCM10011408_10680 [Dyella caseinilytica]|nr:hypothetical protein GCM10011408_10680 [Dyella caseinilytica]
MPRRFFCDKRDMAHAQAAGRAHVDIAAVVINEADGHAAACRRALEQIFIGYRNEIGRQRGGGQSDEKLGTDTRWLACCQSEPGQGRSVHGLFACRAGITGTGMP